MTAEIDLKPSERELSFFEYLQNPRCAAVLSIAFFIPPFISYLKNPNPVGIPGLSIIFSMFLLATFVNLCAHRYADEKSQQKQLSKLQRIAIEFPIRVLANIMHVFVTFATVIVAISVYALYVTGVDIGVDLFIQETKDGVKNLFIAISILIGIYCLFMHFKYRWFT